ncbi:chemotaxis protein CheA [Sporocytophaga myxococcoides]|uniref:Chemotaxis protein CheA n=1 Tax=Sporocytophaga myxococcoides TaxID=153721 RepID=A0A098LNE1_9BACT|nr:chemotaxis protein CheA [Sporocytophaga myxococcoides]GAL87638.1 chemotaxis protein CheA [Sporocytophaga myxococcoides]
MDQFRRKFLEEASDLLEQLEKILLKIENEDAISTHVEEIFRVMHTLKGNSSMFGFEAVSEFTHYLENIYDDIRKDELELSSQIISVTLSSVDHLRSILKDENLEEASNKVNHNNMMKAIKELSSISNTTNSANEEPKVNISQEGASTWYVKFKPAKDIFRSGNNPLYFIDDLSQLGIILTIADLSDVPELPELDPQACYVTWYNFIYTKNEDDIRDIFLFADAQSEVVVEKISEKNLINSPKFSDDLKKASLSDNIGVSIKTLLDKYSIISPEEPIQENDLSRNSSKMESAISSIRVSSNKVDEMMSLVSELVTAQARLNVLTQNTTDNKVSEITESIEKITRRIRDNSFSICLVPFETIVVRFQRLIRDLSTQLNKNVKFITEGTDTELDKNIIENLSDPILHILRNCLDHGIESKEERIANGKQAQGTILLKAFYTGSNVNIQITDDGKGIDFTRVKKKAEEKNIIPKDSSLTEKEILNLIFLPGFSTAEKVTEISGRGVGMDVVKRQISDLRGEVDLISRPGKGTTLTIKLPLTLSIIDGLLVRISDTHYIIPLGVIEKCFEVTQEFIEDAFDDLLVLDGERQPFINLRTEFCDTSTPPTLHQIVMIKSDDKKIGLTIDAIVGQYQAVLKPLGKLYKNIEIISGASILGDGTVALVLDTNKIIKEYSDSKMIITV